MSEAVDNETLGTYGLITKRAGLVDPPTKASSFDQIGEAEVKKVATPPGVGEGTNISAGTHKSVLALDKDKVFGTGAADPCVIVMMILPDGKGYVVFHFYASDDIADTLSNYNWPKGTKAVVVGGNDDNVSRWALAETISYLKRNEISTTGVRTATGLWVDSDGKLIAQVPG